CVEFACSPRVHKGFPPLRTPTEKTCKKNRTLSCPSLTKTDGSLGPWALKSCPLLLGGPGERTVQDGKKQKINSPRPQAYLRVCVCPVSPVCVPVCRVCAI